MVLLVPISNFDAIENRIDPKLQDLMARNQRAPGNSDPGTAPGPKADPDDTIAVLLRLEPNHELPDEVAEISRAGSIVSGRMRLADALAVHQSPAVASLKASTAHAPLLHRSLPNIGLPARARRSDSDPAPVDGLDGSGVVVGFIDFGFDFKHPRFSRLAGGGRRSCLIALWDQNGGSKGAAPVPFGYGREFNEKEIANAFSQQDRNKAYRYLDYDPDANYFRSGNLTDGAHATSVADIAVGNAGIAPGADVIFVQALRASWDGAGDFGNSARVFEAADYIFRTAKELRPGAPVVVNVSLGTQGGPHDGSTLLEQGLDALVAEASDEQARAIVIAAGNSANRAVHSRGTLRPGGQPVSELWHVAREKNTWNELELWYPGGVQLRVSLRLPGGLTTREITLGEALELRDGDTPLGYVFHRSADPNNDDNHVDIVLRPSTEAQSPEFQQSGDWWIDFAADRTPESPPEIEYHIWLEREIEFETRTARGSRLGSRDASHTLGSIACGQHTIVAGAHRLSVGSPVCGFSGRGPVRVSGYRRSDDRVRPDVTAPGAEIEVAKSHTDTTAIQSGTSFAAPHVTGVIALMMQAAQQSGKKLDGRTIRRILRETARPHAGEHPSPAGGFGRLDAIQAVERVRTL